MRAMVVTLNGNPRLLPDFVRTVQQIGIPEGHEVYRVTPQGLVFVPPETPIHAGDHFALRKVCFVC